MEKHFITALLVLVLLAPQLGLEAKSRYNEVKERDHDAEERHHDAKKRPHSRYNKSHKKHKNHKKHRHSHGFKAELKKLKRDISDIKDMIDDLELEVDDDLLEDLKRELKALDLAIGANLLAINANQLANEGMFNEIGTSLAQIESNNMRLSALEGSDLDTRLSALEGSDHESRITALELSAPPSPDSDLVFSEVFSNGVGLNEDSPQVEGWDNFRSKATGLFTSIEIRNSLGGSVICSDPEKTTEIAGALNNHDPSTSNSEKSVPCEDKVWNIGACGLGGVELNVSSKPEVCACSAIASVRPLNVQNWGGFGSLGGICELQPAQGPPPTQRLEVILAR